MNCVHCGRPLAEAEDVPGTNLYVCAGLDGCEARYRVEGDGTLVEVEPPGH
ncbi:MAG: hypothetical protein ACRDQ5_07430 [Sciscionella sp.]